MKIINEEKRRVVKEQAYNKYADVIKVMMEKKYYSDFDNMVSSMVALNLAAEATKRTLVSGGVDEQLLDEAAKIARDEITLLMEMKEKGLLKELPKKQKKQKKQKKEE